MVVAHRPVVFGTPRATLVARRDPFPMTDDQDVSRESPGSADAAARAAAGAARQSGCGAGAWQPRGPRGGPPERRPAAAAAGCAPGRGRRPRRGRGRLARDVDGGARARLPGRVRRGRPAARRRLCAAAGARDGRSGCLGEDRRQPGRSRRHLDARRDDRSSDARARWQRPAGRDRHRPRHPPLAIASRVRARGSRDADRRRRCRRAGLRAAVDARPGAEAPRLDRRAEHRGPRHQLHGAAAAAADRRSAGCAAAAPRRCATGAPRHAFRGRRCRRAAGAGPRRDRGGPRREPRVPVYRSSRRRGSRSMPSATATPRSPTARLRAPDVLVSDVLMPGLDGFELIERLRADERTAVIPVLLLSARGGEESRIEGIAAGADDYLVKPLSSRELIARVDGAVRLGRLRREAARREQADLDALFSMAPDAAIVVGPSGRIVMANEQAGKLFGYATRELLAMQVEALMPTGYRATHVAHREAYRRAPVVRPMHPRQELRGVRADGTVFIAEIALGPLQFKNQPCTIAIVHDVTERPRLEQERAEQERRFRELSSRLVDVQEAERRQLSTRAPRSHQPAAGRDPDQPAHARQPAARSRDRGHRRAARRHRPSHRRHHGQHPGDLVGSAARRPRRRRTAAGAVCLCAAVHAADRHRRRTRHRGGDAHAGAGNPVQPVPDRPGGADQLRQAREGPARHDSSAPRIAAPRSC